MALVRHRCAAACSFQQLPSFLVARSNRHYLCHPHESNPLNSITFSGRGELPRPETPFLSFSPPPLTFVFQPCLSLRFSFSSPILFFFSLLSHLCETETSLGSLSLSLVRLGERGWNDTCDSTLTRSSSNRHPPLPFVEFFTRVSVSRRDNERLLRVEERVFANFASFVTRCKCLSLFARSAMLIKAFNLAEQS